MNLIELAKRAIACTAWQWLPGMLATRQGLAGIGWQHLRIVSELDVERGYLAPWIPDLTDPATVGLLLCLVRRAAQDPYLTTEWSNGRWWVLAGNGGYCCGVAGLAAKKAQLLRNNECCVGGPCHEPACADSEVEALIKVLEYYNANKSE